MVGNEIAAHFEFGAEVVVVVHVVVGLEERDSCSLVVGSPGMVVVVVGILGRLMEEEGMLVIDVSLSRLWEFYLMFVDQMIDILADLGGANSQFGQSMKLSITRIKWKRTRKMLALRRGRRRK